MQLAKMSLFSFAIIGLFGQLLNGQEEAAATAWIKRSGASVELLFRGRVLNVNGEADETAKVQVIDHPDPLANRPRVRDIRVGSGEFRFASDGLGFMTLYACSEDRAHQAVRTFAKHELASLAASGKFDIQLKPSKPLLIHAVDDGVSVANAKVLVEVGWMLKLKGETDAAGIAKIAMPQGQEPNSIRVWTEDFRLGSLDFRDSSKQDINKSIHLVELSDCKPMKVRVVDSDGKPKPDLAIHLGVSDKKYHWVVDNDLFEGKTDANGEATFEFFPDWKDERHFLYSVDRSFFVRESKDVDGVFECKLGNHAVAEIVTMQFQLPEGCPGGMLVEGWSGQGAQEYTMTVFFSRLDSNGKMTAEIVPGYKYEFFLNDSRWVSKPMAGILVAADSSKPIAPYLEIVEGTEIEIRATAGPDYHPVADRLVRLETGAGGRRWTAFTDSDGKIVTRAYPSKFSARLSEGSRNVERSMVVAAGGINRLELHREVAGPTALIGRLVASDPAVDLKDAIITMEQADSNFVEPIVSANANHEGKFEAELECSRVIAYAITADGKYSGATLFRVLDKEFNLPVHAVGTVSGRVLDENDLPISGGDVFASASMKPGEKPVDAGNNWPSSLSVTRFNANTDADGYFKFDQLPSGIRVLIGITTVGMKRNTFRSVDEVFLDPGERRENKIYRPTAKSKKSLEQRYVDFVRNCEVTHTHGLIVLGGTEKGVDALRQEVLNYDDYKDVGWYLPFVVDPEGKNDPETPPWLAKQHWTAPKENELRAIAIDGKGGELGQLSLQVPESTGAKRSNREKILVFVAKHRIQQQDAREKLNQAIEDARASNRRVWAKVSGTRCGPCIRMSNWLETHRGLIDKAFVLVDIDSDRDLNGQEISAQLKQQGGIPWHVMLNDKGEILVTSEAPIGNIGMPDASVESMKHMRKMLTEAASELMTPEEIESLLNTLQ